MYCSIDDIKNKISEDKLAQLTDDSTGSGELAVNSSFVNGVIERQSDFIDGFMLHKYTLPITNDNALNILKPVCIDLCVYELYARRNLADLSDSIIRIKTEALRLLRDIQKGIIKLDRDGESSNMQPRHYSIEARTNKFTNDYLDKMP